MAEINVEPKKSSPLLWIIILIVALLILFFLFRSCNKETDNHKNTMDTTTSSTNTGNASTQPAGTLAATEGWEGINYSAPAATYEEIKNKDVEVRNDPNYTIYSLGQNILFDVGKSTIKSSAENNLEQIAQSIKKRYDGKKVRIYGFTDSEGTKDYNKQLAEARAEAVKSALVKNGVSEANLSVDAIGESHPAQSNSTAQGRQQNRRVEIVVKNL